MTKKRKAPSLEEVLDRPWCYYCERDFDDIKILIDHQKAKHLKCSLCNRRLNTAGGVSVHMNQVHKENLTHIENTIPGREDPNVEIFGMEGIPADVRQQYNEKKTQEFYSNGGRAAGMQNGNGQPVKKAKVQETSEERLKRLAEFRAQKAAARAQGGSGPGTPTANSSTPQNGQVESHFPTAEANSPNVFGAPFGQPPAGSPVGAHGPFGHSYGPPQPFPNQYSPGPMMGGPMPGGPMPPGPMPGAPMPGYGGPVPPPSFPPFPGPPHGAPFDQYPVQPPFMQPPFGGPPAPNGYGRGAPNNGPPFNHSPRPGPHQHHDKKSEAPKNGPSRQNSLPSAPGLPARPSFDAPPVSRHQMHELHQGHKVQENKATTNVQENGNASPKHDDNPAAQHMSIANGNGNKHERTESPKPKPESNTGTPQPAITAETPEAKPKTNDSKSVKVKKKFSLVIRDHNLSPEEKMASMSRYAYTPRKPETYRGPPEAAVARPARGYSDVAQPA